MKNKKWLISLALVGVMLFAVAFSFNSLNVSSSADAPTLSTAVNLENLYAVGTKLTVPVSEIEVGGVSYPTTCAVVLPGGEVVSVKELELKLEGKYVLDYRADTPDGMVSVKKEFYASKYLFETTNKNSTAFYGSVENAPTRPGVVASLARNERLVFNQVIDMNDKTKNDALVELFVNPIEQGLSDALNLVIVLTDAYDSENTVTFIGKRLDRTPLEAAWQEKNFYCTVNGPNQPASGLEKNASGEFDWEGSTYKLHQNDLYGAPTQFAMAGIPSFVDASNIGKPTDIANQSVVLSMDYAEKRVYVNGAIIADLDDVSMFKSVQWKGFSTGECLMSVYALGYNQDSFNFVVTKACGLEGEDLSKGLAIDTVAPVITLDKGAYEEVGYPDAVVGRTFPIPRAVGFDNLEKEIAVSAKVYKDYGTNGQVNVTVKNGAFIPQRRGNYSIVYTASDSFGNVGTLIYDVKAVDAVDELAIALGDYGLEGETGKLMTVAEPSVQNGHGFTSCKITAIAENGEAVNVELDTLTFRPMYGGKWTIEYQYSDYLETKVKSYDIDVISSLTPYIEAEVALPKYVIRGASYTLPSLQGYVFIDGQPVLEAAQPYVSDDAGEERALGGDKFTSYAKNEVTIVYRLGEGENLTEKSYVIPVIDVDYDKYDLSIEKYFKGESFTAQAKDDRITMLTNADAESAAFEFINPVQVFNFRNVFAVGLEHNNYTGINVYLTDSLDPSIVVKASYIRKNPGETTFVVNDGSIGYSIVADFVESTANNFNLVYTNADRKISPSSDFGVLVEKTLGGQDFNGFPSGRVFLTYELVNVTGEAGLSLLSINNQPISNSGSDFIRPEISQNLIRGERYLGDEIAIKASLAADVLDPDLKFSMSVLTPNGKYAVATDGTVLDSSADTGKDYTFIAEEYGAYSVSYLATDASGNQQKYSYVINVKDVTPPTVSLGAHITEAKVGDTIVIAPVSAKDDYSECSTVIMVKMPNSSYLYLKGNAFKATFSGTYTVYYFVQDADYNVTTVSYEINVK